jgi:hypothetical protein
LGSRADACGEVVPYRFANNTTTAIKARTAQFPLHSEKMGQLETLFLDRQECKAGSIRWTGIRKQRKTKALPTAFLRARLLRLRLAHRDQDGEVRIRQLNRRHRVPPDAGFRLWDFDQVQALVLVLYRLARR